MSEDEQPQIYLISPPDFDLMDFPDRLAAVLDAREIACVRLALATHDEDRLCRAADALREVTHARDVALVIDRHILLAERMGLDGVHLEDGARSVRKARKALGPDAIIGAYCAASRHEGMNAGEAGCDYISFGPVTETALVDGEVADTELFEWWSQMIELPVVAEGGLDPNIIALLAPVTDFFGIGDEIWREDDSVAALHRLTAAFTG
ncbi:thiamine phosphate synthase [Pseudooceanicola sediminis]|uniref:Thiamine phosphate synthase n=1 Tax=Pseudooceanicola sediminis TaxID=2211117 RepID=A0A399J7U0_9RHOB|nr:thiamine phosphate synthase [Pseudooceanicola sediminis]KAA2316962.1 thiamine phosphate synthase [Puniceibacterium sp. HSS470]RII40587.1 thiamine phosphate synthase [Pseudooceanicola sediminis]|tara:strand:+ start:29379 stop:30002 length:624 start_codon:yes stop_codon:yes gene_type:complete